MILCNPVLELRCFYKLCSNVFSRHSIHCYILYLSIDLLSVAMEIPWLSYPAVLVAFIYCMHNVPSYMSNFQSFLKLQTLTQNTCVCVCVCV